MTQWNLQRNDVLERLEKAGQSHAFRYGGEIGEGALRGLVAQAGALDLSCLATPETPTATGALEPLGDALSALPSDDEGRTARREAHEHGIELLNEGRVAVVIAAGGQGTRLGSEAPKGLWPCGPTSGKPLLQWISEKVTHWTRRIGRRIPVIIMVSDATAAQTERLLHWHGGFGLDPTWVRTAVQGTLPCVDDDGKLLLAAKDRIATAPNGHGGVYRALRDAKLLDLLDDHGVTTLSYVQVDNPLVQPVDPVFLGLHASSRSHLSSKSVAKTQPEERVGVFARRGGRVEVVEYSELSAEDAQRRDGDRLVFGQGSIAAHAIDLGFAREIAGRGLPLHRARKIVPYVDDEGRAVTPDQPNAWKLETFLFDALQFTDRALVVETDRAAEFAPIKNAAGADSPETARQALVRAFRGWYARAELPVPTGLTEVNPLEAPDERAFRALHGLPARA